MMESFASIRLSAMEFVKKTFASDSSGHDDTHTFRVHALAKRIALAEGADLELVELAALLHDVDDHKLSPETAAGKDRAVGFLRCHGVGYDRIMAIIQIIDQVSFSRNSFPPSTLEGKCVQDADRLDAMGAIGIARTFAYGGSKGRRLHDPQMQDPTASVQHFYDKLLRLKSMMNTETGRQLAAPRHEFLEAFLEEFLREWEEEA